MVVNSDGMDNAHTKWVEAKEKKQSQLKWKYWIHGNLMLMKTLLFNTYANE